MASVSGCLLQVLHTEDLKKVIFGFGSLNQIGWLAATAVSVQRALDQDTVVARDLVCQLLREEKLQQTRAEDGAWAIEQC